MNGRKSAPTAACAPLLLFTIRSANAQQAAVKPTLTPDGVVHVPAFDLPPLNLSSLEAVELQKSRAGMDINPYAARRSRNFAPVQNS